MIVVEQQCSSHKYVQSDKLYWQQNGYVTYCFIKYAYRAYMYVCLKNNLRVRFSHQTIYV